MTMVYGWTPVQTQIASTVRLTSVLARSQQSAVAQIRACTCAIPQCSIASARAAHGRAIMAPVPVHVFHNYGHGDMLLQ